MREFLSRLTGPGAFRPLAVVALIALYVNIVSGALVRVTNSGLGCPDWPLCNGRPTPAFQFNTLIEFTNRVLALIVIIIAVLFAITAYRSVRRSSRWLWRGALWIGILTFAQGPLGGITVLVNLHPIAVMSHFLLAIVVLLISVVIVLETFGLTGGWSPRPAGWLPWTGVLAALWAWATIISGGVATMSGTHPGSDNVPRLWNLLDAVYVHVRVAASFIVFIAVLLIVLSRVVRAPKPVTTIAWALVLAITAQVVIGEWQWRTQLPWYLTLLHVAVGSAAIALAGGFGWLLIVSRREAPATTD
ncbi:MAG: COX15/CtaA family protein [Gaiellales bacterium]